MLDLLFGSGNGWFGIPAILGTIFFVVRLSLMLVGGAGEVDVDFDADVDTGLETGDGDDSGDALKVLSVQSLLTFMMGFGWGGLAARHGFGASWVTSLVGGIAVGVAMLWVLGLLLKAIHDLQSSGNVQLRDAVDLEGSIYTRVPPQGEGRGQVRVVIDERMRIVNAVSSGDALERNAPVRVIGINGDNTLTVMPA